MTAHSSDRRALPKVALLASLLLGLAGCGAFFPEISTRFTEAPKLESFDPPPPADRHFVKVAGGKVPARTRDGRAWDQAFGSLPDPSARVIVNGVELFRTNAEGDTLAPSWPDSPSGNFRLAVGDKIEVQLWDNNPLNDTPIGTHLVTLSPDMLDAQEAVFPISGGGEVTLAIKPAKPIWGAGFWYELRNDSAYVTRVIDSSPASRQGVKAGDRILSINSKNLDKMSTGEMRSHLGSFPTGGLTLTVQHSEGATLQVVVKEGPIYPLFEDYRQLPVLPK